jgi:hypothetical protein
VSDWAPLGPVAVTTAPAIRTFVPMSLTVPSISVRPSFVRYFVIAEKRGSL